MLPPIPPILAALAPMLQESARPAREAADAAARDAREEALRAVAGAVPDATREAAAQAPAADTASRLEELARAAAEAAALDAGQSAGDEAGETDEDAQAMAARETRERIERVRKEAKAAREEAEAARAAADELRDLLAELRAEADAQALRLGRLRERVAEAERFGDSMRVSGALDKLAALDEGGGGSGSGSQPWPETVGTEGAGFENPHAFQVIVGSGGEVCVYVPKSNDEIDNRYFGGAYGGAHLGNESNRIAPSDAGPFTREGVWGSAPNPPEGVDCNWAHFGWLQVGSVTPDSSTQDKMVVAEFMVPRDPPEEERDDDTEVQGPQLTGFSFIDASAWKEIAKQTWKQFDPSGSSPVPRKVPIALVANGSVTQLTMTPFLSLGGGSSEDWHPDSECGVFLSLDPKNEKACPKYVMETREERYNELENHGSELNPDWVLVQKTRQITEPKKDENGNPIQAKDEEGNPAWEDSAKHQIHNFRNGEDGAEIEPVDENGYPKDLVCTRVKKGLGYEVMWRKLPSQTPICPPEITVSETSQNGCHQISLTFQNKVWDAAKQQCVDSGTPRTATFEVCDGADGDSACCAPQVEATNNNPNPPTNNRAPTLAGTISVAQGVMDANGNCSHGTPTVVQVYNGQDGQDGCTPDVVFTPVPLGNTPTVKGHATKAATLEITPCGGQKQTLDIYNGQDGEDGADGKDACPLVVEDGAGAESNGKTVACKIYTQTRDANGACQRDPNPILVLNGKDGEPGAPGAPGEVCGSFDGFGGIRISDNKLQYGIQKYKFALQDGCYRPVKDGSVTWTDVGIEFQSCS